MNEMLKIYRLYNISEIVFHVKRFFICVKFSIHLCRQKKKENSCRAILVSNLTCDFKSNSRCALVRF